MGNIIPFESLHCAAWTVKCLKTNECENCLSLRVLKRATMSIFKSDFFMVNSSCYNIMLRAIGDADEFAWFS